jgi:hypothetical protein
VHPSQTAFEAKLEDQVAIGARATARALADALGCEAAERTARRRALHLSTHCEAAEVAWWHLVADHVSQLEREGYN